MNENDRHVAAGGAHAEETAPLRTLIAVALCILVIVTVVLWVNLRETPEPPAEGLSGAVPAHGEADAAAPNPAEASDGGATGFWSEGDASQPAITPPAASAPPVSGSDIILNPIAPPSDIELR